MSAEKITVTLDPEALEVVLLASKLAADKEIVRLSEASSSFQQIALAAEFAIACDALLSDLEEARLAQ